ncbi:peptidase S8/S53 domain-containing protein, partial [Cadophora sp. MPI-SDFR-AT-0126]
YHRLELKVESGRLWKLKSERCSFQVDRTETKISLDQFIKDGSRSLTEKTKRILAVLLSYTVLHLQGTPWLQSSWGSSNIIFFRTTASIIPLKPFIQVQLVQEDPLDDVDDVDPDDIDPDDIDPDDLVLHHCPAVVTLAIMLMELYLATPFEVLAKKYNIELSGGRQSPTISIDADLIFQECKSEIPENSQFRYAVEKCLDPKTWQDDEGKKLEPEALRTAIYREIVRPLEDELSQAFSYISIDELDKIAQTLDFGSWGQTIQKQQENASLPSQSLELYRPAHDFRYGNVAEPFRDSQQLHKHEIGYHAAGFSATIALNPSKSGHIDYKSSNFFDDETISEDHSREACLKYMNWKRDYQSVYEKFVERPFQHRPQTPIKIAILDTGVDLNHPDMDARDHQIKGKYNWTSERFRKMVHDNNGHGTHTAGLLLDYAPDAELYIAKIAETKPSSPEIIAKAIDHTVNTWQVDIISMSFGFPTSDIPGYPLLEEAIAKAYSKNILLFAAASNSGGNLDRAYPARDQNVICIHSTDANGNRSNFSPTALSNDTNIATIGEAVESAWPVHLCDGEANPTFVKYKSGTSYATPIAVGIAAFLLQYAKLHLSSEQAEKMRRQSRMKAVLRRIAQKGLETKGRDDYHYVALSLYSDNLFGKSEAFTRDTINDGEYSSNSFPPPPLV